jgi:ferritin
MISKKMTKDLTQQINTELYSAYLYFSMASYATSVGLRGTAHWMFTQAQEETAHALKQSQYLQSQGEHVVLAAIEQPPATFASALDMFEQVVKHEKKVTAAINALTKLSIEENDYATQIVLQWFVSEQVEEEAHAIEIVGRLKMIGASTGALLYIDKELGKRTFTLPDGVKLG